MPELTAIVTHNVHPGKLDAAADRIRGNGDRMAVCGGFVDRVYLVDDADGDTPRLVTITRWKDRSSYDQWVEHNRTTNPHKGHAAPFDTPQTILLIELPVKV